MDLVFFISCQSNVSEALEKPLAQELELQEDSSGRGNQTFPQLKNLPLPMAPPPALDPIPCSLQPHSLQDDGDGIKDLVTSVVNR